MSRGYPSMTALLGLLAVAGYQNRDKIAELLGGLGKEPARSPGQGIPPAAQTPGPSGLGGLLGGAGAGGVGGRRRRADRQRPERARRPLHPERPWRGREILGEPGAQPRPAILRLGEGDRS